MIKKALNYDSLKENNFQFVKDNQLMSGKFRPLDSAYTELLAKYDVAKDVVCRLGFYAPAKIPEMRLVFNNEQQIVGTFQITKCNELTHTVEAGINLI